MIDKSVFENKIAAYYTLGCKLNFAETSAIGKLLTAQGVRRARKGEKANICIVNTCSVTELADKKCRQTIRKIGKFTLVHSLLLRDVMHNSSPKRCRTLKV